MSVTSWTPSSPLDSPSPASSSDGCLVVRDAITRTPHHARTRLSGSSAKDNGCDTSASIPTTMSGSKAYLCYDFPACKPGYPVKVCTFDGMHTPASVDDGTRTEDDCLKAFVPPLAWKFISQL